MVDSAAGCSLFHDAGTLGFEGITRPQDRSRVSRMERKKDVDGRAVFSCILPIAALEGRSVTTLEGLLEDSKPNKVQQAFIAEQAAQCGYCIAGMVMRAQSILGKTPHPTDDEIRKGMQPNLCRCGTHAAIMRAVKRAAAA